MTHLTDTVTVCEALHVLHSLQTGLGCLAVNALHFLPGFLCFTTQLFLLTLVLLLLTLSFVL